VATESNRPVVLRPGEGTLYSAAGVEMRFKVVSEDTGGRYAFYEYQAPAGFGGPPPHTHPGFDEAWYVLEGELTMTVGDQQLAAPAGTFLHVPGATVHAFANPGQAPARFVGLLIPGSFERYFAELPAIVAQHGYPPPPAVMAELSRKYGIYSAPPAREPLAAGAGSHATARARGWYNSGYVRPLRRLPWRRLHRPLDRAARRARAPRPAAPRLRVGRRTARRPRRRSPRWRAASSGSRSPTRRAASPSCGSSRPIRTIS
jgi:mannose-6-phosphate isomerase-like protein (cupin superfamily)